MILKTISIIFVAVGLARLSEAYCYGSSFQTPQAFNINLNSAGCYNYAVSYPSPSTNPLTMRLSQVTCNSFLSVVVTDNTGRVIYDVCANQAKGISSHLVQSTGIFIQLTVTILSPTSFSACFQFNTQSGCPSSSPSPAPAPAPAPATTLAPVTTAAPATTTAAPATTTAASSAYGACGKPVTQPDTTGMKIVGGFAAIQYSFPWQVYLVTDLQNGYVSLCGGSLINNQWIVTAAHCVDDTKPTTAYLGLYYSSQRSSSTARSIILKKKHPNYDANRVINDIALMKLSSPVTFGPTIQPICLPNSNLAVPGRAGIVTGWGDTSYQGSISNPLLQVTLPIQQFNYCGTGSDSSTQFCAGIQGAGVKDSCQGDSGGPFILNDQGNFVLAGVVSFGGPCDGTGIYTNVFNYKSWISSTIAAN